MFATKFAFSTPRKWVFHGLKYLPIFRIFLKNKCMNKPFKTWWGNRVKGLAPPLDELVMVYKHQLHKWVKNKVVAGEEMQKNQDYRLLKILFLSHNRNWLAENIYLNSSYENVYTCIRIILGGLIWFWPLRCLTSFVSVRDKLYWSHVVWAACIFFILKERISTQFSSEISNYLIREKHM